MLEIQIIPRRFDNSECSLIVIRNVSYVLRQEKQRLEASHQQLIVQTMSHEQLTPLNAILNLADMLKKCENNEMEIQKDEKVEYIDIIWSSGKMMEY